MNRVLTRLKRFGRTLKQRWPASLSGMRTSTVVLIIAMVAVLWVYLNYQHASQSPSGPHQAPSTQVVPPGFVPDPAYTWVPRTRLEQQPPPETITETETAPPVTHTVTATPQRPSSVPHPPPPPPLQLPPPLGPRPPAPGPQQGTPPGPHPPSPETPPKPASPPPPPP